jgi:hypothetical protein
MNKDIKISLTKEEVEIAITEHLLARGIIPKNAVIQETNGSFRSDNAKPPMTSFKGTLLGYTMHFDQPTFKE